MRTWLRFYTLGMFILMLVACGRTEGDTGSGHQNPVFRTISSPLIDATEIPTYVPIRTGSVITVDLAMLRPTDVIEMTSNETLLFINRPLHTTVENWYVKFDSTFFKKSINNVEQQYIGEVPEEYPLSGWVFKPQKNGTSFISLYNLNTTHKDCGSLQCVNTSWGVSYEIRVK